MRSCAELSQLRRHVSFESSLGVTSAIASGPNCYESSEDRLGCFVLRNTHAQAFTRTSAQLDRRRATANHLLPCTGTIGLRRLTKG